ncbi:MAG: Ig-like domain-containing protein [Polyangiaceae bacterium]|nr:Ig-like domain-containing protein [Polyangiaceae bacterium]
MLAVLVMAAFGAGSVVGCSDDDDSTFQPTSGNGGAGGRSPDAAGAGGAGGQNATAGRAGASGAGSAGRGAGGGAAGAGSGTAGSGTAGSDGGIVGSSTPAEGETNVYPIELYKTAEGFVGERRRVTITFREPMSVSAATATLRPGGASSAPPREVVGTWSAEATTIEFTIGPAIDAEGNESSPLEEGTSYGLDLRALRDASGATLGEGALPLGDGVLDFVTGARDYEGIEHACFHTLVGLPGDFPQVTAGADAATAPPTNAIHKQYTIGLPGTAPAFAGFTTVQLGSGATAGGVLFYFDKTVPFSLRDTAAGVDLTVEVSDVPPACAGITRRARAVMVPQRLHLAAFGPTPEPAVKLIIERE